MGREAAQFSAFWSAIPGQNSVLAFRITRIEGLPRLATHRGDVRVHAVGAWRHLASVVLAFRRMEWHP